MEPTPDYLLDAADDVRTCQYVRTHLPQELQEKFSDEDLEFMLDAVRDYYFESDAFEAEPDAEGFVEIDIEAAARYVANACTKQLGRPFNPEEVRFFVDAELDSHEEEEE